jgi:maltooligosyltrehalose trehalohydrolase
MQPRAATVGIEPASAGARPNRGRQMGVRRVPVGAEVRAEGGVHFRVWAPKRQTVEVVIEGGPGTGAAPVALEREGDGCFSGTVAGAAAGTLYRYRLDGGDAFPDPASRFQPRGPHGPSEVIDPGAFAWSDEAWRGAGPDGQVVYELHVGCFTPEGTWEAAAGQLAELARLGVTVVEVMPVAEFPGEFGWGYDGVDLYAPTRLYGRPDDFRRFVDRAHAAGLGVILDVVYNHLGPDGNYLTQFSDSWFTDRHETEWGEPIGFYGPGSGPVREFYVQNAVYWIREFHLDGLRLDATQSIFDRSAEHVVAELTRAAREAAAPRRIFVVAENEPQETVLVRAPERGGWGLDGLWNDDLHHAAMVALTGRAEAYYTDYRGTPQELVSAAKWGYLYQGQRYAWQKQRRGTPALDLPARAFVTFIQNHDQVANSDSGKRIHALTSPARLRAMTAYLLLIPGTPMLFMGQEFAASARFLYFADHEPELARKVWAGRREFLAQFPSIGADADMLARIPDPADRATFEACKLDLREREANAAIHALHGDLLRLRRETPAFAAQDASRVHGAVLGPAAFCLRYLNDAGDRLLVVNLGAQVDLAPAPEPLLAPPAGMRWAVEWSSESPGYEGAGTPPVEADDGAWTLPGETALVLAPKPRGDAEVA